MWFLYLLFSVATAFGISVALVKKGDEWPVSIFSKSIRWIFGKIYKGLPAMLDCVVCTSFWVTLLCDVVVRLFFCANYFAWPLSGFIAVGISYVIIDFLDSFYALVSKDSNSGSVNDEK